MTESNLKITVTVRYTNAYILITKIVCFDGGDTENNFEWEIRDTKNNLSHLQDWKICSHLQCNSDAN